jgi:hypothetical protein
MLKLPLEVLERMVSFGGPQDVPTFQFRNLDTLIALLARWSLARHFLRHVDVQLVSGPQDLNNYALHAWFDL